MVEHVAGRSTSVEIVTCKGQWVCTVCTGFQAATTAAVGRCIESDECRGGGRVGRLADRTVTAGVDGDLRCSQTQVGRV